MPFREADAIDQAVTACADKFIAEHPDAWCDATLDDVLAHVDRILTDPNMTDIGKKIQAGAIWEVWRRLGEHRTSGTAPNGRY